ncbi:MAG: HindIII family type II restriction endonuclease [Oscillospiraceae bacterium]|nr:HindIII family type II restriction endonuclease [Oscillospiraceae bacterium]
MGFNYLISLIAEYSNDGFYDAAEKLNNFISSTDDFMDILTQIGTIPESISLDSTEEKLFSKASDMVLSRAFRELGLKSTVLSERADSADVIADSNIHGYTLVADAKAFRLSRTAKNQKDFKVVALSGWRTCIDRTINRGNQEKSYWETEREIISSYSREQAITELIKSKKIDGKIRQIDSYIRGISRD